MDSQKKINIVALIGESGSGKDAILNWIVSRCPELNKIVGTTTRPPRDYEIDGKDYHFIDFLNFNYKEAYNNFLDVEVFNDWHYGISIDDLDPEKINIGVVNFQAIEQLYRDNRVQIYTVFINAKDKTRLLRQLNREINPDCNEIVRRFLADREDFNYCDLHIDLTIDNEDTFEIAYNAAPLVGFISSLEGNSGNIS